jgi:predicted O-methyltransferase YrrM
MRKLHELIIRDQYDVGGLCTEEKGEVIKSLIEKTNAQLCVEIGVYKGSSLLYFAEALQTTRGRVIGIDPYKLDSLKNEIPNKEVSHYFYEILFKEQKTFDDIYFNLTQIIENNNLKNLITLVRDKSENFYQNIKKESIDVLHIDGNHDEEYVTKDILNYLPLVKKGGYIIMDDISWIGVINSINNHLIDRCRLVSKHSEFAVYIKE